MSKGLLRKPVVLLSPIIDKILLTHLVVIGLPAILYYYILENGWNLLLLHVLIPALYFVTAIVVIGEAVSTAWTYASRTPRNPRFGLIQRFLRTPRPQVMGRAGLPMVAAGFSKNAALKPAASALPKCSLVVAAYLPNEQHIILNTLEYILKTLDRPEGGLELILAYNRPERLPIEDTLERLAEQHPELKLLCVENSHSKAHNVNAALDIATGEVTGILDADHHPNADCFARAWRWLEDYQYVAVQGRNVIRNHDVNFMTRMIGVEFECMYGVSHPAKSLLADTGMFCGSNGYWRTSVLQQVRFSSRMLTEDIDATLRTLLSGYNIVHDPTIVTTELAPVDLRAFWFQRKRWAQGWLEVTLKHQVSLLRSAKLDSWQKFYWSLLLVYSAGFHFLALQVFPMFLSLTLSHTTAPEISPEFVWTTTLLTLISGPLQTLAAWLVRDPIAQQPARDFIAFCLFIPFYCIFKSVIAITAIYDHLVGNTEWVVTKRGLMDSLPAANPSLAPKRINS